jgi:hypothetical protein
MPVRLTFAVLLTRQAPVRSALIINQEPQELTS